MNMLQGEYEAWFLQARHHMKKQRGLVLSLQIDFKRALS
jgi:hypothetical protein